MPDFIPGLELSEGYYREIVQPILAQHFSGLEYAAGLMGSGSDVLGLDTEASMDHSWGPRLQVFLSNDADVQLPSQIHQCLATQLPYEYRGFSTSFRIPDPREKAIMHMVKKTKGPVDHLVRVSNFRDFTTQQLGVDASGRISEEQWLAMSQHQLFGVVKGKIFRDDIGLENMISRLEWYPRDVWLFMLGCTWWRFRRTERVIGSIGKMEDELGASVLAGQLVQDLMRLGFCMERKYTPYSKWLGTFFKDLKCATTLGPHLRAVMGASDWKARDEALAGAYETVAAMHNKLGLTDTVAASAELFGSRGFHVINCDRFAQALFEKVQSPRLSQLFKQGLLGNIDLITDHTGMSLSILNKGRIARLFAAD